MAFLYQTFLMEYIIRYAFILVFYSYFKNKFLFFPDTILTFYHSVLTPLTRINQQSPVKAVYTRYFCFVSHFPAYNSKTRQRP